MSLFTRPRRLDSTPGTLRTRWSADSQFWGVPPGGACRTWNGDDLRLSGGRLVIEADYQL